MKKLLLCFLGLSLGLTAYANQYMVVQCNVSQTDNSGTGKLWPSYYTDPQSGKLVSSESCGEALSKVPANYFLKSSTQGSGSPTYLFSANSGIAPQQ